MARFAGVSIFDVAQVGAMRGDIPAWSIGVLCGFDNDGLRWMG
jgi:hypothetical protein